MCKYRCISGVAIEGIKMESGYRDLLLSNLLTISSAVQD